MKGTRLLAIAGLIGAGAVFAAAIRYADASLPERVASHFNGAGKVDGWMRRADLLHELIWLPVTLSLPLPLMAIALRFLPRRCSTKNSAWCANALSPAALDFLVLQSLWWPILIYLFCAAQAGFIVAANRRTPPTADIGMVFASAGALLAGFLVLAACTIFYFPKAAPGREPDSATQPS